MNFTSHNEENNFDKSLVKENLFSKNPDSNSNSVPDNIATSNSATPATKELRVIIHEHLIFQNHFLQQKRSSEEEFENQGTKQKIGKDKKKVK